MFDFANLRKIAPMGIAAPASFEAFKKFDAVALADRRLPLARPERKSPKPSLSPQLYARAPR